jgi:hypothetical protein
MQEEIQVIGNPTVAGDCFPTILDFSVGAKGALEFMEL